MQASKTIILALLLSIVMLTTSFSFGTQVQTSAQAGASFQLKNTTQNNTVVSEGSVNNSSLVLKAPSLNVSGSALTHGITWDSMLNYTTSKITNKSIPTIARLLPNFDIPSNFKASYGPSYQSAPAPMGLASYGLRNVSGSLTPFTYNTTCFDGTVNINNVSEFYMGSDSPYTFSIQMNSVLTGVTLFGVAGYQYWIQNVAFYSTRTHQLTLVDNIWNFSSPTAVITGGEFNNDTGTVVPGLYYYKVGPTFNVDSNFSLSLILNTANVNNDNGVFLNYSINGITPEGSTLVKTGSYDRVIFNSIKGSTTAATGAAHFEVSGSRLSDNGAIPLDAELDFGGPGGGSTADFTNMNSSLTLMYKTSSGNLASVPSAYDSGSATGETSSGISAYFIGAKEFMDTGPSFITGLWNISGSSGFASVSGSVYPDPSFLMVSKGKNFVASDSQVAPISANGVFSILLMPGTYSFNFMLSYYDNISIVDKTLSDGFHLNIGPISLSRNYSMGLYTPFYITDNSQISQIAYSGHGTLSSPYIIPGPSYQAISKLNVSSSLNPAFSAANDYLFPEYDGIIMRNTDSYVMFSGFSSQDQPVFKETQTSLEYLVISQYLQLPQSNFLPIEFYNSSDIIFSNNTVSTWFTAEVFTDETYYNVPFVSSLVLWNVTNSLISSNMVKSQGSGILIYDENNTSSSNYVWGNVFTTCSLTGAGSYYGSAPIGLIIESSGNTVFNNIFDSAITLVSLDGPHANIYNDANVTYHDNFNISKEPANYAVTFDGQNLKGSIINGSYVGGNFYYNYFSNGVEPYNGSGLGLAFPGQNQLNGSINDGYDYYPLTIYSEEANISASGLPSGVTTYFDVNNAIFKLRYGSSDTVYLPNGTYQLEGFFLFNSAEEFLPTLYVGPIAEASSVFYVDGPVLNLTLLYTLFINVTFSESGLPAGTIWGFTVLQAEEGFILDSSGTSIYLRAGTIYTILPQAVTGYYTTGIFSFSVSLSPEIVTIIYVHETSQTTFSVTFMESGLSAGSKWTVFIGTQGFNVTTANLTIINIPDGNYSYSIASINGYEKVPSGTFTINNSNATIQVMFVKSSSISAVSYLLIVAAAIGGLILGSAIVYVRYRKM